MGTRSGSWGQGQGNSGQLPLPLTPLAPPVGLTENAGRENDGPKMTAGRKVAGEKNTVLIEITVVNCAKSLYKTL